MLKRTSHHLGNALRFLAIDSEVDTSGHGVAEDDDSPTDDDSGLPAERP